MEKDNVKLDNYGCLTIATPKSKSPDTNLKISRKCSFSFVYPYNDVSWRKIILQNAKSAFVMRDTFFASNCEKNEDGTRTLILNGKDLEPKIGRRFQNWDVPYLILFLPKNEDVTRLILPNNDIDSAGFINLIDYTTSHDHILELDLRNNQVGNPGINFMFHRREKVKLEILRLTGNKIGATNAKRVAITLAKNAFIQQLDVDDIDQTVSSVIYYTTVLRTDQMYQPNKTLRSLNLSRPNPQCMYTKLDSVHLANSIGLMLRYNDVLEELHLQKFNFYCHDIEEMLTNAVYNKTLRILDLNCNNIGDHGAELFSNWLQARPPLRALLLGRNIISNHGVRALSRGVPFSKLLVLDVSRNRFDDEGGVELFYAMKKSPLLKHLRIFGNKIGCRTAKVAERMVLAKTLNQENIDVIVYEVNGKLNFAYHQPTEYERNTLLSSLRTC